ncbi:thioesterase II family protein [Streptomyces sp. NPDC127039]|uniref:thioesterase II family protein n=1 Tax=Streptomyces sp. NPDC127039 TaxID=3347115 RepID=UPI003667EC31
MAFKTGVRTGAEARWLRRLRPGHDTAVTLVCFAHAGGAAGYWQPLAEALPPRVEVLAVQYPGRQDRHREPAVEDLHRLAETIAGVLADSPRVTGTPWAFLGHSMGASVAYETAALLSRAEDGPGALFVSGRRAPSRPRRGTESFHDDHALLDKVRRLGGTGTRLLDDADVRELILPALRADYRAVAAYTGTPGAPLSCPVVALAGDGDTEASVDDVAAWAEHTTRDFELRVFEGGHFFLADQWAAVARLVASRLPGGPA